MKIAILTSGHEIKITDNDWAFLHQQIRRGLTERSFPLESGSILFGPQVVALIEENEMKSDEPDPKEAEKHVSSLFGKQFTHVTRPMMLDMLKIEDEGQSKATLADMIYANRD